MSELPEPAELRARLYLDPGLAPSATAPAILFDGCRVVLRFDDGAARGDRAEYAAELVLEDWPYVLAGQDTMAVLTALDPPPAGALQPNATFVLWEGGRPVASGTVTGICERRAAGS